MENKKDLTTGRISSKLLAFFFPMLLTNILQQFYTVADTAIVGRGLGDDALAAVGNLSSMSLLIIGFSMGMTTGFSVIIAQHYGANNMPSVKKSIALAIKLSSIMAVVLTVIGCFLLKPILFAMNTDEIIFEDSMIYGLILFGGLAATIAYNLCSSILRSLGDSKTPFIAILISAIVNIVLDCLLIFVLHTGVEGPAIATIIAQALSACICFQKIWKIPDIQIKKTDFKKDVPLSVLLLKNGIPMACMNSITAVGCMVVQGYVNDCGVAYTSAYSVCSKYLNLFMLPALTAGFAISPFVSQNFGAKKTDRIKQGVRVSSGIALISYVVLGAIMCFLARPLADFMLNEEETISLAAEYLRICGIGLLLLNLLFIYRNATQGMGFPFVPMLSGIVEMTLRIPTIILLLPKIGFRATAYAEIFAWIGALSLNIAAYLFHVRKARYYTN